jgi:hypothetical protein
MSWKKHQTRSFRKLITIDEWAAYTGMHRIVIINNLKAYRAKNVYDTRDIYAVFNFLLYLIMIDVGLKMDVRLKMTENLSIYTLLVSIFKGMLRKRRLSQPSAK